MMVLAALPTIRLGAMDLPILHAMIAFFVPLVLVLAGVAYAVINHQTKRQYHQLFSNLAARVQAIPTYGLDQIPVVAALFAQTEHPALQRAFERLQQDQDVLYQQRWLPDPSRELALEKLVSGTRLSALKVRPAITLLSIGLTAALIALILRFQLPLIDLELASILPWAPALTGIVIAALLAIQSLATEALLRQDLAELCQVIGQRVPVFGQQTGIAQLIESFFHYDHQMVQSLDAFNATASRLAESDMANGIRRSVEQVLFETVAPALRDATTLQENLSKTLIERQEQGMAELAGRFSNALAADITAHLGPVNRELSQLAGTMSDIKNYTDFSIRAMETVRQEMLTQQKDIRAALDELVSARSQFQTNLSSLDSQIARLSDTATRLGAAYTDHEATLAQTLIETRNQLEADQKVLNSTLQRSSEALARTHDLTLHQQQMVQQLISLDETLKASLTQFAAESEDYVTRTMDQMDQGLADIVERLAYATAEIRDAVEALPAVLRQNATFR
ncbi:MAG: hypothetical protein PHQ83_10050 [Eubacteriales bacterium]|nr:hypothetical protein [Eubacteriales bacterium]